MSKDFKDIEKVELPDTDIEEVELPDIDLDEIELLDKTSNPTGDE